MIVLYLILGFALYALLAGTMMGFQRRALEQRERREQVARLFRRQDEA